MTATIARLPVQRKRGPKVRKGPCASVVEFPKSLESRWIAFFMVNARPEDAPGDNERTFRSHVAVMRMISTHDEMRERLDERIQYKRDELERQLAELDRI